MIINNIGSNRVVFLTLQMCLKPKSPLFFLRDSLYLLWIEIALPAGEGVGLLGLLLEGDVLEEGELVGDDGEPP